MKKINLYITERFESNGSNKEAMFLHKDTPRAGEKSIFTVGEKALLIKYDTDGY